MTMTSRLLNVEWLEIPRHLVQIGVQVGKEVRKLRNSLEILDNLGQRSRKSCDVRRNEGNSSLRMLVLIRYRV